MKKVTRHKRPQPWTWAQEHEERALSPLPVKTRCGSAPTLTPATKSLTLSPVGYIVTGKQIGRASCRERV